MSRRLEREVLVLLAFQLGLAGCAAGCRDRSADLEADIFVMALRPDGSNAGRLWVGRGPTDAGGAPADPVEARLEVDGRGLVVRLQQTSQTGAGAVASDMSAVSGASLPSVGWNPRGREDYFNWRPVRLEEALPGAARLTVGFDVRRREQRSELLVMSHVAEAGLKPSLAGHRIAHGGLEAYGRVLEYRFESMKSELPASVRRAELADVIGLSAPTTSPVLALTASTADHIYRRYRLPTPSGSEGRLHCIFDRSAPPRPGLLYLSGHFRRSSELLSMLSESVKEGMVACGLELHNFGSWFQDGGSHHFGAYWTLLGEASSRLFVEEAILGLEVLRGLPEVDSARIGVAGVSFGGTLAALVGAVRPDIAAVAVTAGAVSFRSLVGRTGSDAEQHPIGLAALGGMEAVAALVAPRPLLLLFAEDDHAHGRAESEEVSASALEAYAAADAEPVLQIRTVEGGHDEGPAKRRAMLDFLGSALNAAASRSPLPSGLASYAAPKHRPTTLLALVRDRMTEAGEPAPLVEVAGFAGAPTEVAKGQLRDILYALPASDAQEPPLATRLWRLRADSPRARILVVEEAGLGLSGFALGLRRCGVEVFLHEPRTFGVWTDQPLGWRRMWLALASASLGRPLGVDLARDLATAVRASTDLAGAPLDLVWSAGPEMGAAVLFAAASGAFGAVPVVISDGPGDLAHRAAAAQYPPWSLIVPGLLRDGHDLDQLASLLGQQVRITSSRPGLGASFRGPFAARVEGGAAVLERLGFSGWSCEKAEQLGRDEGG